MIPTYWCLVLCYVNPQGKVPHNNVPSEVGLHENILKKSMVREYYEETQERKRRTQHSIATKNYCLAKKNYENFKRQTGMNDGRKTFENS